MSSTAVPTTATDKAGFWIRVGAYLIDAVILFIVNLIVGLIFRNNQGLQSLIELIVSLGYFVYFWSASGGGQTLGMRALKIKVVKTDGSQLDYGGAVLRYVGLLVSFLVIFIGVIWVAFDPNKQGWHDKIASTYVVRA
ncbi:MAG: RDD family protein [Chloroflexi bacterium]|nr:MAG: RDD family protein [Chloroflexota bacterium]